MSYKGYFWRGKIVGILFGSMFGIFGGPLFALAYPEFLERTFGNDNLGLIFMFFWGGILGGVIGAVLGTAVGLLLAWSGQGEFGTVTGLFFGGIVGVFLITAFAPDVGLGPIFLPLLGLVWGGFIGWGAGNVIERRANAQ